MIVVILAPWNVRQLIDDNCDSDSKLTVVKLLQTKKANCPTLVTDTGNDHYYKSKNIITTNQISPAFVIPSLLSSPLD